jgi:CheY-like chemotaxis protein
MSALFDEIEKRFSTKVSFSPKGSNWVYKYSLPDLFPPVHDKKQEILFVTEGEEAGTAESISAMTVEFMLASENCLDFLDTLDSIIKRLEGTVQTLRYYLYRPWLSTDSQPKWLEASQKAFPYMVWGNYVEHCIKADLGELKAHIVAERRNWWRSQMSEGKSGEMSEGVYCSGRSRIAFQPAGRDGLLPYIQRKRTQKSESKKESSQGSIIVVDDNDYILELLSILLRNSFSEEELEIISCNNGPDVFGLALKHKPGLILLDIMMPEKDGLQVLQELKADERTRDIKVVMLSVLTDDETIKRAEELGAARYLTKPFVPYDISEVVRELLPPGWSKKD